eukprot:SAG11_NODE_20239_length_449_cov_2.902857_1_plen_49_part_10
MVFGVWYSGFSSGFGGFMGIGLFTSINFFFFNFLIFFFIKTGTRVQLVC